MTFNQTNSIGKSQGVVCPEDYLTSTTPTTDQNAWFGKHWSYYVSLSGSLVGSIIAVAGLILNNEIQIYAGGALFVTAGISACYINREFGIIASFSRLMNLLTSKIKEVAIKIGFLKEINDDSSTMNNALTDSEIQLDEKINELMQSQDSIKRKEEKIQETEKKLNISNFLYKKLKISMNFSSSEMQQMIDQSIYFKDTGKVLKAKKNKYNCDNDESIGVNFDKETWEFVQGNLELSKFNEAFITKLLQIKSIIENDQKIQIDQSEEIEQLNNKIGELNKKIEEVYNKKAVELNNSFLLI